MTAAAFVATIDEVRRFHRAHEVEAYLGLVPRELSSGESQRRGHITKAGHARLRWLLIQAAVSILLRRLPQAEPLRVWALRIAARRGKHCQISISVNPGQVSNLTPLRRPRLAVVRAVPGA